MKTTATLGLALLLGASAYAGEVTTTTNTYSPPPPSPSSWNWFVGGSGGYFFDNEEDYWTLHFGAKLAESCRGLTVAIQEAEETFASQRQQASR